MKSSFTQPTSDLLPPSLPVFSHNSSEENVESESFDAPFYLVSLQQVTKNALSNRTEICHMLFKQSL